MILGHAKQQQQQKETNKLGCNVLTQQYNVSVMFNCPDSLHLADEMNHNLLEI